MKFLLQNSQRLFYWTGGALLVLIAFLILIQFTDIDRTIFKSLDRQEGITAKSEDLSFTEKLDAGNDVLLENTREELSIDGASKKAIEERIKEFLRVWETFPRKDYKQSLEPFVVPSSLTEVAERRDSEESDLLRCPGACDLASRFPAQEIPISIVQFSEDGAFVRFTAFVRYKSLSGKATERSGLYPRKYALLLSPRGDEWLILRAVAR